MILNFFPASFQSKPPVVPKTAFKPRWTRRPTRHLRQIPVPRLNKGYKKLTFVPHTGRRRVATLRNATADGGRVRHEMAAHAAAVRERFFLFDLYTV